MRILLTADPEIAVPPLLYGGIERIIDMLIQEYLGFGHEVFLLANPQSETKANLIPYSGKTARSFSDTLQNLMTFKAATRIKPDVIHSFGRLAYLLTALGKDIPKIMSYQREPTLRMIKMAMLLSKRDSLFFTGCSDYITHQIKPIAPAQTIYNGVPLSRFNFVEMVTEDAPLVFLGRIEPIKGPHYAIELAKKTNRKLIIAGNIPPEYQKWAKEVILSQVDGNQIMYIGPVNDEQKNQLLRKALAFLMLIDWNEPFGIVMAEALACGTPIIGFKKGSVPEVVTHGETGFICTTLEDAVEAVESCRYISRTACRKSAETRFSSTVIATNYLNLYKQMML